MNREVHVRFWESAGLQCPAPLDYRTEYRNIVHARAAIGEFLEKVYNEKRLHSALEYRSPVQFERTLVTCTGLETARVSA
jgi:transposase InsO family protein